MFSREKLANEGIIIVFGPRDRIEDPTPVIIL
jgi:hypothetical protein